MASAPERQAALDALGAARKQFEGTRDEAAAVAASEAAASESTDAESASARIQAGFRGFKARELSSLVARFEPQRWTADSPRTRRHASTWLR